MMLILLLILSLAPASGPSLVFAGQQHPLYPAVTETCPEVSSPFISEDGREYLLIELTSGGYGLVDVTRADHPEQIRVDATDFPTLANTGLHDPVQLAKTTSITGRPVAEITALARPGGLSGNGFLAADEDILSVLAGDNELVRKMGLSHPELAAPLFHIWNLMNTDLDLQRWSMAHHQWRNVRAIKYHGHWVKTDAHDTKGGQKSPFDDGLEGAFWMVYRRALSAEEEDWLHDHYGRLDPERWDELVGSLTRVYTGDMEAFYIQWYGFYEGHTGWRTDPVGMARVFGLRTLAELEAAFPKRLDRVILGHHTSGMK